jgi:DNA-binding transcriptional LysR family regulator
MELADLAIFVEAVRVGSLAGAARRLGVNAMAASRRLAALEAELGVRLVHRTTRSLSPTADGEAFLPHAQAMLDEQASALEALRPTGMGLSGQLRVTASAAFGRKVVAPMIVPFMRDNPNLHVDLLLTDDQLDIVGQGIDVAVRIAKLRDNHLVARRLADNPRLLCASPAYVDAHGAPRTLAELAGHHCLTATGTSHWTLVRNGKALRHKVAGRFTASSIEALHEACVGGLGIANISTWNVESDLRDGRLQHIALDDAEPEPLAIWAVYPSARMIPRKVRAFVDALERMLRQDRHAAA